ncbi:undecaprenyl-diphosphate phosphatase [soil metagenome]
MPHWLVAVILGLVEGLTEFIPVSSTGHLLITERLLNIGESDFFKSELFNVVIQCGAVIAVLPLFRKRIEMMLQWRNPASRDLAIKVFVAFFLTGLFGLVLKKLGLKLPETVQPIALALIIGGIVFIAVEGYMKGRKHTDFVSWGVVAAVVVGQLIAAAFPGSSRSGSTIMLAMLVGISRSAGTEYSFLVAIPTMLAAGAYEIYDGMKSSHHGVPVEHIVHIDWPMLALATVVSAIVSFIAVKWLLRYVQTHSFVNFGIYRIVLGVLLLLFIKG